MRYILVFCWIFLFSGCSMFCETEESEFLLPYYDVWEIYWTDENGCPQCKIVRDQKFSLDLKRNFSVGITASSTSRNFLCGTIYPVSEKLNGKHALASQILYTLTIASSTDKNSTMEFLSGFNWQKFMEECDKYSVEELSKVDRQYVMSRISQKVFRASDLKKKYSMDVEDN